MNRTVTALLALIVSALSFSLAHADTPVVTSLTATPNSINNAHDTVVAWSISGGTGADVYVSCPTGVTVLQYGSNFPCNTRQFLSTNASDQVGLTFFNISGTSQNIRITVYPKDSTGADYDAGQVSTTLSLGTAYQTITDFSVSPTVAPSGSAVTFTWTGTFTPSTNMILGCGAHLMYYESDPSVSPAPTALPCGTMAFTSDLPTSGSKTLYVKNDSIYNAVDGSAQIIPAIVAGSYDGLHSKSVDFTVQAAQVVANANPTATSFTASSQSVTSGNAASLSWTTSGAAGANMRFECPYGVTVSYISDSATTTLPCNALAFTSALSTYGTTTVIFNTSLFAPTSLRILLLPQDKSGSYYQSSSKEVHVTVYPAGVSAPLPQAAASPAAGTTNTPSAPVSADVHAILTIWQERGTRSSQTTILQTFLALNPTIYPEGLVTGFYGPATERAVGRFQIKYGIAGAGDPGYGDIGPKTRAKINSLVTP